MYEYKVLPIDDLIPYANNSRTHSEEQVNQVASMLSGVDWRFYPLNDCYVTDSEGNVYSVCTRQKSRTGNLIEKYQLRKLRGSVDKYGYITYRVAINGKKKHVKAHRMILLSFQGESNKPQVNHINGIKADNSLKNLEYVTALENVTHAKETGLWNKSMAKPKRKIGLHDYTTIYLLNKIVGLSLSEIARRNRVARETISVIVKKMDAALGGVTNG